MEIVDVQVDNMNQKSQSVHNDHAVWTFSFLFYSSVALCDR